MSIFGTRSFQEESPIRAANAEDLRVGAKYLRLILRVESYRMPVFIDPLRVYGSSPPCSPPHRGGMTWAQARIRSFPRCLEANNYFVHPDESNHIKLNKGE